MIAVEDNRRHVENFLNLLVSLAIGTADLLRGPKVVFRGLCFTPNSLIIDFAPLSRFGAHLAPTTLVKQWMMYWNLASRASPIVCLQNQLSHMFFFIFNH